MKYILQNGKMSSNLNGKEFFDFLIQNTGLPENLISPFLKQLILKNKLSLDSLNIGSIQNILRDEILRLIFEQSSHSDDSKTKEIKNFSVVNRKTNINVRKLT